GGLLTELNATDPAALFAGSPSRQIGEDYYWSGGGEIIEVSNLATALSALDTVISQGEGAWAKPEGAAATGFGTTFDMGQYCRFSEIYYKRRYKPEDDPESEPTGEAIDVDFDGAYPIVTNPRPGQYPAGTRLAELNDTFNRTYTKMLLQVNEAMNGTP